MGYVYVLGDIHGNYDALQEVVEQSDMKQTDMLIHLGDVVDGPDNRDYKGCIEFLAKRPNTIGIRGNHDNWFWEWLSDPYEQEPAYVWLTQGGYQTLWDYRFNRDEVPLRHVMFIKKQKPYYEMNGLLFIHGGLPDPDLRAEDVSKHDLMWDRQITNWAKKEKASRYTHVFCGHTTTELIGNTTEPLTYNNVTFLDTGAGWHGKLTLAKIDLETGEMIGYWQA